MTAAGELSAARDAIAIAIDNLPPAERETLDNALSITAGERFAYQTTQASAHAIGRISAATAGYLYRAIGEAGSARNGNWPEGTTLADKVLVTRAIGELLNANAALSAARAAREGVQV